MARQWTAFRSLKGRNVLGATLVLSIALFVGAVILRSELNSALKDAIEKQTLTRAKDLAALAATGDAPKILADVRSAPGWVQVIDDNGKIVASTINASALSKPFAPFGPNGSVQTRSGLTIDTGEPVSVATVRTRSDTGALSVLVATSLDLADPINQRVVNSLFVIFPMLIATSALVVWFVSWRALQPVEEMRASVAGIVSTSDLARRVPTQGNRDEIGRLGTTMNDMLERMQNSVLRQQRFVGDASHELRSPLASLRSQLEVSRLEHPEPTWSSTVDDMLADHDRLEKLVGDLLLLARFDQSATIEREPIDLGFLVRSEMSKRGKSSHLVHVDTVNALVEGDESALVRVLRNLVDNAERHATTNIWVHVSVAYSPGTPQVLLRVEDDGPGIPNHLRQVIFDRFTRLDNARSADSGGSGLGLAIVADIVHAHGGEVRVLDRENDQPGGCFAVFLSALVMPE